jgi:hypothetical protein
MNRKDAVVVVITRSCCCCCCADNTNATTTTTTTTSSIMGRGKVWSAAECKHLAEAWLDVSEDKNEVDVKGVSQDGDQFWDRVFNKYVLKGRQDGCYGERAVSAVRNFWSDNISRDCKKFNKSLIKVYASRPTGVTLEEKINIAVALHLKKADTASSRHRSFNANDWKFYQAWLVLKEHSAFIPPSPQQLEEAVDLEDEEENTEQEESGGNTTDSETRRLFTTPGATAAVAVSAKSKSYRGPGPGAKKTKKLAKQEEYQRKKTKLQESMVELATKRAADFTQYVNNNARAQAWNMAMSGYNTFKDSDPARVAHYKQALDKIMFGDDANDVSQANDDSSD